MGQDKQDGGKPRGERILQTGHEWRPMGGYRKRKKKTELSKAEFQAAIDSHRYPFIDRMMAAANVGGDMERYLCEETQEILILKDDGSIYYEKLFPEKGTDEDLSEEQKNRRDTGTITFARNDTFHRNVIPTSKPPLSDDELEVIRSTYEKTTWRNFENHCRKRLRGDDT